MLVDVWFKVVFLGSVWDSVETMKGSCVEEGGPWRDGPCYIGMRSLRQARCVRYSRWRSDAGSSNGRSAREPEPASPPSV